ncbi:MAG: hypothetical protein ACI4R5_02625, partial [Acetatifactor sp.]
MKRLFKHTKRPYEDWNEYEYDENSCDWDMEEPADAAEEYYEEEQEEYAEDYYTDESYSDSEEYYEEGTQEEIYDTEAADMEQGEYYAVEAGEATEEYYPQENAEYIEENVEEGYVEEGYVEEGYAEERYAEEGCPEEGYAENEYYAEEDYQEPEEYYSDEEDFDYYDDEAGTGVSSLWSRFTSMAVMDRIIMGTGVAVLLLALITGGVYISAKMMSNQVEDFVSVGTQLQNMELIGEKGLLAVADAERAKQEAANAIIEEQQKEQEENKGYNEAEYDKTVTVTLNMTSVQKDLKIKFINKETGKLIANVPFSVIVTKPDGKSETWSDSDMDGIIYEKNIAPGSYKVAMNALTEERYSDYILPAGNQLVEVKKEIAYKKVDVSDEVKKESEIDVSVEDTKKNETVVESVLQDTVEWVESTSTVNTYTEVLKSTIPDPLTLAVNSKSFLRTAYTAGITPSSQNLAVGSSFTVTAKCTDDVGEVNPST